MCVYISTERRVTVVAVMMVMMMMEMVMTVGEGVYCELFWPSLPTLSYSALNTEGEGLHSLVNPK